MAPRVATGLDILVAEQFARLRGRRLGLLTHAAAVDCWLRHVLGLMLEAGLELRLLLGPEHGLDGAAQDMRPVADGGWNRLPVLSLYGERAEQLRPPPGSLDDLDTLVVDLQDVGSRYYTYAATMLYCLRAAAAAGVAVVVLDRPNPLGGILLEGPLLPPRLRSFVGELPVPVRHGLTLGELARLACELEGLRLELEVVAMSGWRRRMWFDETGLPWVLPSPNMPTLDTATVYPGGCLLEATNLSEGRGTTRPFEIFGAPWLEGERLAELLTPRLDGAVARPLAFKPTFHKHAGRRCGGVQLHVTGRERFRPFAAGLAILWAARRLAPDHFAWRSEPYEFVTSQPAIDLLSGDERVGRALDAGQDPLELQESWQPGLERFAEQRRQWLLYPEES